MTKRRDEELFLPDRAIVLFTKGDMDLLLKTKRHAQIDAWSRFRKIYIFEDSLTIVTRVFYGGPNIGALVEELSAFGVREFILIGYCGGIDETLGVGDVILAKGALREDGLSYHYLPLKEGEGELRIIESQWFDEWCVKVGHYPFYKGIVWSCDAIYRETKEKVERYRKEGILGVEMEVSSFYGVIKYKGLSGIAFLIVSDVFSGYNWAPGFNTEALRQGRERLIRFIYDEGIR
ncbi:MAG: nucleoside phosphorylase [Syntrophorhabdaceae bacterium]|nr:nucleoside phosphorylase [Syntrophorhabdaceae bacterium]